MIDRSIQDVLKSETPRWMSVPGVVGTALGASGGRPCLMICVEKLTPEIGEQFPESVAGYPVVIRETGPFRAVRDES